MLSCPAYLALITPVACTGVVVIYYHTNVKGKDDNDKLKCTKNTPYVQNNYKKLVCRSRLLFLSFLHLCHIRANYQLFPASVRSEFQAPVGWRSRSLDNSQLTGHRAEYRTTPPQSNARSPTAPAHLYHR